MIERIKKWFKVEPEEEKETLLDNIIKYCYDNNICRYAVNHKEMLELVSDRINKNYYYNPDEIIDSIMNGTDNYNLFSGINIYLDNNVIRAKQRQEKLNNLL